MFGDEGYGGWAYVLGLALKKKKQSPNYDIPFMDDIMKWKFNYQCVLVVCCWTDQL